MNRMLAVCAALAIAGCGGETAPEPEAAMPESAAPAAEMSQPDAVDVFAAQPAEVRARYQYRHPQETLEFFGVEPGMTVAEALPGGGWYSKLLLPYLGEDGQLIGADYPYDMVALFPGMNEERLAAKRTWVADWTAQAETWRNPGDASVTAFQMNALPDSMHGTADAYLFIRALHNLARFEEQGGFLSQSLDDAYKLLKPGGIVGVVQHHARDDMPDEWANGNNGYLKKDYVVAKMEAAGFELVDSSDLNANDRDQPTTDDAVWRLPPTLGGAGDNPELEAQMRAIGESNRMTLKFRKPLM